VIQFVPLFGRPWQRSWMKNAPVVSSYLNLSRENTQFRQHCNNFKIFRYGCCVRVLDGT
jgi:hypothetical protein